MPGDDTEIWEQQRFERLTAEGRTPYSVDHFEWEEGGIAWVPGEFLVDAVGSDLLDLDGQRGADDGLVPVPDAGLPPGVRLFRRDDAMSGVEFLAYVQSLRAELRSAHAVPDPTIGVHYVLSGEMKGTVPRGGPASTPWVAGRPQDTRWGAGNPVVAIVDTGIDRGASWSSDVAHEDSDIDPLYVAGAPAGTLGSQGGHGTFIASLVERMSGGDNALRSVRVLDVDGSASELEVVQGLATLRQRPDSVDLLVVNLSLGGFSDDGGWVPANERDDVFPPSDRNRAPVGLAAELARWAIERPDTVFVAAAGNDGQSRLFWPAALADPAIEPGMSRPTVVAVGSVQRTLEPSSFSNTGSWVSVSTLGEDIVSEYPVGRFPLTATYSEPFTVRAARWSGTSFAAPLVAAEIVRRCREDPANPVTADVAWQAFRSVLPAPSPGVGRIWDPRSGVSGPARDPRLP